MFALRFREYHTPLPGVTDEFEAHIKRLNAFLQVAHNDDGSLLSSTPVGALVPYLGTDVPPGWLRCDGAAVPRARYPLLFKAIGTRFGGVGATFKLPDLRDTHPLPYLICAGR